MDKQRQNDIKVPAFPLLGERMMMGDGHIATGIAPESEIAVVDEQTGRGFAPQEDTPFIPSFAQKKKKQAISVPRRTFHDYFIPIRWESTLSNTTIPYGPDRTNVWGDPTHYANEGNFPYGKFGLNNTITLIGTGEQSLLATEYAINKRYTIGAFMGSVYREFGYWYHPKFHSVYNAIRASQGDSVTIPGWANATFFDVEQNGNVYSGGMALGKEKADNLNIHSPSLPHFKLCMVQNMWAHEYSPEILATGYSWVDDFGWVGIGEENPGPQETSRLSVSRFDDERGQIVRLDSTLDLMPVNNMLTGAIVDIIIPNKYPFIVKVIPYKWGYHPFVEMNNSDLDVYEPYLPVSGIDIERHKNGLPVGESTDIFQCWQLWIDTFPYLASLPFIWGVEFWFEL